LTRVPPSRVTFDHQQIMVAVKRLANELEGRCADQDEWLVVCVMNGGMMFAAALLQELPIKAKQDFVRVSRYRDQVRGGSLEWIVPLASDVAGRNVLVIDDIFDEGDTLAAIVEDFRRRGAVRVLSVVLVEKDHDRKVDSFRPDLVGLVCPDRYVFGFGMDVGGYWRNLPEIRELLGGNAC
jgi:hypoxanthine phosphoribosyltransferase